jgi:hypothetical protein
MLVDVKTIQALAWRAAAQQRQQELFQKYQNAGDMESAHFVELPPEKQQTAYAAQDIQDAVDALHARDVAGFQRGVGSAVQRAIYGGAQLGKPQRQVPRRKRGR